MFKNDQTEAPKAREAETIIGPSVKVKGNFYGYVDMVIEGLVEGNVKTKNNLRIGNKSRITAQVEAKDAYIGGEVLGNIKVTGNLEIAGSARIKGDIEARTLSIEKGAQFNGHCSMGTGDSREEKK